MSTLRPVALETEARPNPQVPDGDLRVARVDLAALGPSMRLRCGASVAARARQVVTAHRRDMPGPWLTYIGSGDFHHVTLMLLETLILPMRPLTLVLIDHHPDWFRWPPRYHCGNWVAGAMRLPFIDKVILLGQDSEDLRTLPTYGAPLDALASGRLEMIPWRCESISLPFVRAGQSRCAERSRFGSVLRFRTMAKQGIAASFSRVASELSGRDIYLSIDKDCLRTTDAATDWEQGEMQLADLAAGLAQIQSSANIIGADICGERAMSPLRGLIKRVDAGRVGEKWREPLEAELALNRHANRVLSRALLEVEVG